MREEMLINIHLVYPGKHFQVATAVHKRLKNHRLDAGMVRLEEPGNPALNTLEAMEKSEMVIVLGNLTEGGEFAKFENVYLQTRRNRTLFIGVHPEETRSDNQELAGEVYPLWRNHCCVPGSLISAIASKVGVTDPFVAVDADWDQMESFLVDDLSAAAAPALVHSGAWLATVRSVTAEDPNLQQLRVLRALIAQVLGDLKAVHSFHPFVVSFLVHLQDTLDGAYDGGKLKSSPILAQWRKFEAISECPNNALHLLTNGLRRMLLGLRSNLLNDFPLGRSVTFLDLLIEQISLIPDRDCQEATMLDRAAWLSMRELFETEVLDLYFREISRNDGLPAFIPEGFKPKITQASQEKKQKFAEMYQRLYRDSYELASWLVSLHCWAEEALTENLSPPRLGSYAPRLVYSSNNVIMLILDVLAERFK